MADTTSYFSWAPIGRFLRFYASREDFLPAQRIGLGGPGIPGHYTVCMIYTTDTLKGMYRDGVTTDLTGRSLPMGDIHMVHVNKTALTLQPGMVI